ncbi:MAG: hypothetical protein ACE5DI_02695 [Candidatus Micrarchaeia archaeon]
MGKKKFRYLNLSSDFTSERFILNELNEKQIALAGIALLVAVVVVLVLA